MAIGKHGMSRLLAAMSLAACAGAMAATADMKNADGNSIGRVTLTQTPSGVLLKAELHGLTPGGHGFHVHEKGACSPDFGAAGDHYNPTGAGHGLGHAGGSHAGDMPNIYAAADGTATAEFLNPRISIADGASSVFDADGSAIVVHEKPDTHSENAGAGGRVACGVISR